MWGNGNGYDLVTISKKSNKSSLMECLAMAHFGGG